MPKIHDQLLHSINNWLKTVNDSSETPLAMELLGKFAALYTERLQLHVPADLAQALVDELEYNGWTIEYCGPTDTHIELYKIVAAHQAITNPILTTIPGISRIVAGNYREYQSYLEYRELHKDRAVFVDDPYQLYGLDKGTEVIFTGNFTEVPSYDSIMAVCRDHGLQPVFDTHE